MSRTVGGGWNRTVELHDGEQVLFEQDTVWWNAGWLGLGSTTGKLYVTNQRLIWARDRLMPPIPRQPILVIAIGDILDTEVYRWRVGVQTEERKYWFNFGWIFENRVKRCRDVIAKAIRGNETTA